MQEKTLEDDIFTEGKYILKNKRIYKCKQLKKWAEWFENNSNRIIKQDYTINGYLVSTVFLGFDHNFTGKGKPVLFETMVFDQLKNGNPEEYQTRYKTYKQAVLGHVAARKWWKDQDVFKRIPLYFLRTCITKFMEYLEKLKRN